MNFLEIKNISERYLDLVNPTSPEKILIAVLLRVNKRMQIVGRWLKNLREKCSLHS